VRQADAREARADAAQWASLWLYDNALRRVIRRQFQDGADRVDRVWRSRSQLELAVVEYLSWFNNGRLHESLGHLPPAEFEQRHAAEDASNRGAQPNRSLASPPPSTSRAYSASILSQAHPFIDEERQNHLNRSLSKAVRLKSWSWSQRSRTKAMVVEPSRGVGMIVNVQRERCWRVGTRMVPCHDVRSPID
jgi:hypothetical protein